MPFTLSHAAAVIPLTRTPLVVPALVAGAVAPDLPYFARSLPVTVSAQSWYEPFLNATTSHTLAGAVTVAAPYALVLTLAWWVAERPVREAVGAPAPTRRRARDLGWVVVSVLVGIATHLAWDSFTHGDGYVVEHVSLLTETAGGGLTWARLLQHVSTVVGLVALAWVAWRHRRHVRPRGAVVGVIAAVVAGAAATGLLLGWRRLSDEGSPVSLEALLRDGAELTCVLLLAAAAAYVVAWWARRLRPDASA